MDSARHALAPTSAPCTGRPAMVWTALAPVFPSRRADGAVRRTIWRNASDNGLNSGRDRAHSLKERHHT